MDFDPLGAHEPRDAARSFEAELKESHDPNTLLVRWCLEGKPRVCADLAEINSTVRLAAQLLCEPSIPANTLKQDAERAEVALIYSAFLYKTGKPEEAIALMENELTSGNLSSAWKRRSYATLGWMLANIGDYRAALQCCAVRGMNDDSLLMQDKFALLLATSRLRTEMGDVIGARRDFEHAKRLNITSSDANDARLSLNEARVCFAEGNITQASKLWLAQCNAPPSVGNINQFGEPLTCWFASFAIAAVVGDLGDSIQQGSRQAKHEAANNYAVCCLQNGGVGLHLHTTYIN